MVSIFTSFRLDHGVQTVASIYQFSKWTTAPRVKSRIRSASRDAPHIFHQLHARHPFLQHPRVKFDCDSE
jgi:hypothetical protein